MNAQHVITHHINIKVPSTILSNDEMHFKLDAVCLLIYYVDVPFRAATDHTQVHLHSIAIKHTASQANTNTTICLTRTNIGKWEREHSNAVQESLGVLGSDSTCPHRGIVLPPLFLFSVGNCDGTNLLRIPPY